MPAFLALAAMPGMVCAQWLIFSYAPTEAHMGIIQKIFYIHLPLAWWALVSFAIVCAASILYLFRPLRRWDALSAAAAELGVLFSALALLTGMIWARRSWGVWWTWDPRLATTLVMWFLYSAYLLLRHMDLPPRRRQTICAVFGILAFLDVPLVFFSARIFRSIHPAVFANSGGGLEPEMKIAAICSVLAMGLLWGALLGMRYGQLDAGNTLSRLMRQKIFQD